MSNPQESKEIKVFGPEPGRVRKKVRNYLMSTAGVVSGTWFAFNVDSEIGGSVVVAGLGLGVFETGKDEVGPGKKSKRVKETGWLMLVTGLAWAGIQTTNRGIEYVQNKSGNSTTEDAPTTTEPTNSAGKSQKQCELIFPLQNDGSEDAKNANLEIQASLMLTNDERYDPVWVDGIINPDGETESALDAFLSDNSYRLFGPEACAGLSEISGGYLTDDEPLSAFVAWEATLKNK